MPPPASASTTSRYTAAIHGLVYCNTRGYEKGPRSDLPGTDQTANALSGTEWEDGACDAGNPPMWSRSGMGDTGNALFAAIAITPALYHRDAPVRVRRSARRSSTPPLLHTSYAWIHADGTPGTGATPTASSTASRPLSPVRV